MYVCVCVCVCKCACVRACVYVCVCLCVCVYVPYSGKTINFAVFEDLTTASKINSSKSYYSIKSSDSLIDP